MTYSSRFRKFTRFVLGRPLVWLAVYGVVVLLFPLRYITLGPFSFSQSTLASEVGYVNSGQHKVTSFLSDNIGESIKARPGSTDISLLYTENYVPGSLDDPYTKFLPRSGTVTKKVGAVSLLPPLSVGFHMVARFKRASDGTDQRFDAQITVKCSPSSDEDHCFVYGPKEQAVQTGFIDILDTQDLDDPIVVTTCGDQSTQTNGCEPFKPFARLSVDQAFVDALYHYFRISRNDPLALPGSYGRMLYFSATTITTLGLGDITPVTNTARFYVGLEAVLGIVIAGFFLNAMARTIADRAASKVEDRRST